MSTQPHRIIMWVNDNNDIQIDAEGGSHHLIIPRTKEAVWEWVEELISMVSESSDGEECCVQAEWFKNDPDAC